MDDATIPTKDGVYDDYVILPSGKILGLIRSDHIATMKLLNISADGKTKILTQDINTHERKVVYSTSDAIVRIQIVSGRVVAVLADGKLQELKNIVF